MRIPRVHAFCELRSLEDLSMRISAIIGIALLVASCRSGDVNSSVQDAVAMTSASEGFSSGRAMTLVDAGSIAHAINDGEIQLAQIAVSRASSPDVRNYAQMMIDDHTSANRQLEGAGYRFVKNDVTDVVGSNVRKTMDDLRNRTGADFDRAYLDSQIMMHKDALDTFKSAILPNAQDKTLHPILMTMRDQVQTHLDSARALQRRLGL